ncbi:hypothetical protein GOEFS_106_01070 [Gordonia effusa NBRC 100432]|uniref:Uncharacterized protein n=1 Tax=Gordonia effusa NBRC 100432 TaxID=1077974 RepID=H0R558_9ACTN|nr:hypothetical protein [Gordonia effusa]GAB20209.1 hypothetical protein GOEFS_106_01070 [Gordonia effusa NBRC 100432]
MTREILLDGWTTKISGTGDWLATFSESMLPIEGVEIVARRRANEALDYLCAVEFLDAVLSGAEDDFLSWGTDPDTQSATLRVTAISSVLLSLVHK